VRWLANVAVPEGALDSARYALLWLWVALGYGVLVGGLVLLAALAMVLAGGVVKALFGPAKFGWTGLCDVAGRTGANVPAVVAIALGTVALAGMIRWVSEARHNLRDFQPPSSRQPLKPLLVSQRVASVAVLILAVLPVLSAIADSALGGGWWSLPLNRIASTGEALPARAVGVAQGTGCSFHLLPASAWTAAAVMSGVVLFAAFVQAAVNAVWARVSR
jgi:hypothetical protein